MTGERLFKKTWRSGQQINVHEIGVRVLRFGDWTAGGLTRGCEGQLGFLDCVLLVWGGHEGGLVGQAGSDGEAGGQAAHARGQHQQLAHARI